MYLASLTFLMAALPVLLILYYCIPKGGKNVFLLCSGWLLYGWSVPLRLVFPLLYAGIAYGIGILLQKLSQKRLLRKGILLCSVLLLAGGMIAARDLLQGDRRYLFPIGIALFTLNSIGYLIGIYKKKYDAERNFLHVSLYLTFFPVLFAGPLVSYPEFKEQLSDRPSNILKLGKGLGIFLRGLTEKVILANTLWYVFQELRQTDTGALSFLTAWLTVISFSLYLYYELLGYSEMARGLGECFGFSFPKNFRQPFFSPSLTAFCQSWNITTGLWFQRNFRSFLFDRTHRRWVKYASLVLMWMLIGLWYENSLQLLLWGTLVGVILMVEQMVLEPILKRNYLFGVLYTFIFLQFSWVMFFAENLREAGHYWRAMLGLGGSIADHFGFYYFTSYVALLLICFYIATDLFQNISERIAGTKAGRALRMLLPLWECVLLVFCIASMVYAKQQPFMWLRL